MSIEVKVPVLPESVSDAIIAGWHKKPGDAVKRDENLVDLETDKVVLEVPSPVDGVLKEIKRESGDTVTSLELLAIIEEGGAVPASTSTPSQSAPAPARKDGHELHQQGMGATFGEAPFGPREGHRQRLFDQGRGQPLQQVGSGRGPVASQPHQTFSHGPGCHQIGGAGMMVGPGLDDWGKTQTSEVVATAIVDRSLAAAAA